jgi:hypothetical protein
MRKSLLPLALRGSLLALPALSQTAPEPVSGITRRQYGATLVAAAADALGSRRL